MLQNSCAREAALSWKLWDCDTPHGGNDYICLKQETSLHFVFSFWCVLLLLLVLLLFGWFIVFLIIHLQMPRWREAAKGGGCIQEELCGNSIMNIRIVCHWGRMSVDHLWLNNCRQIGEKKSYIRTPERGGKGNMRDWSSLRFCSCVKRSRTDFFIIIILFFSVQDFWLILTSSRPHNFAEVAAGTKKFWHIKGGGCTGEAGSSQKSMQRGSWKQRKSWGCHWKRKKKERKKSARKAEYFQLGYAGAHMAVLTADGEEGKFVLTQVNSGLKNTPLWWEMGLIPCGCQSLFESVLQHLLFPVKTPESKKLYWSCLKSHWDEAWTAVTLRLTIFDYSLEVSRSLLSTMGETGRSKAWTLYFILFRI